MWAENFLVILTICLPKNGAGAGAQRISLLEVNSPFEGSTRNGVCVCVCVCCVSQAKIVMEKQRPRKNNHPKKS